MTVTFVECRDGEEALAHYGVMGMRWGVRKDRGSSGGFRAGKSKPTTTGHAKVSKSESGESDEGGQKRGLSDKQKKVLKIGAAVAATALVAYGGYKIGSQIAVNQQAGKRIVDGMVDKNHLSLNKNDVNNASKFENRVQKRAKMMQATGQDKQILAKAAAKQEKASSKAQKRERLDAAKHPDRYSDKELQQMINRLNKEKQLKNLTSEVVTPGKNTTKGILKRYGGQAASAVVGAGTAYAINEARKKRQGNNK